MGTILFHHIKDLGKGGVGEVRPALLRIDIAARFKRQKHLQKIVIFHRRKKHRILRQTVADSIKIRGRDRRSFRQQSAVSPESVELHIGRKVEYFSVLFIRTKKRAVVFLIRKPAISAYVRRQIQKNIFRLKRRRGSEVHEDIGTGPGEKIEINLIRDLGDNFLVIAICTCIGRIVVHLDPHFLIRKRVIRNHSLNKIRIVFTRITEG